MFLRGAGVGFAVHALGMSSAEFHPGVRVRSPGKLILSGEHSVSHGRPALAMAVDRFVEVSVGKSTTPGWELRFPDLGEIRVADPAGLPALRVGVEERYAAFLEGRLTIGDVLDGAGDFLDYTLAVGQEAFGLGLRPLAISIESAIPLGSGMGSSAAVASALLTGLAAAKGGRPTRAGLYELAMAAERTQHGRPSGVDVHMCLHGGCALFQDGRVQAEELTLPAFTLIHTGQPVSPTGECVARVRDRYLGNEELWDAFAQVTYAMRSALQAGDAGAVGSAVRENQRLLEHIGVVPEPVKKFIAEIEAAGGSAKVCGAGAVRGAGGGMVIALGGESLAPIVERHGYVQLEGGLDNAGTCIL